MTHTGFWSFTMPAFLAACLMLAPGARAAPDPAMEMHDMQGMENMDDMENMPSMRPHHAMSPAPRHAATSSMTARHGHPPAGQDAVAPSPATGPRGMPEAVRER